MTTAGSETVGRSGIAVEEDGEGELLVSFTVVPTGPTSVGTTGVETFAAGGIGVGGATTFTAGGVIGEADTNMGLGAISTCCE